MISFQDGLFRTWCYCILNKPPCQPPPSVNRRTNPSTIYNKFGMPKHYQGNSFQIEIALRPLGLGDLQDDKFLMGEYINATTTHAIDIALCV